MSAPRESPSPSSPSPSSLASTLALAFLVAAAPARANPVDGFGLGSRATAMGGAGTAISEDSSANYYNPAGLVRGSDLRLDVGYRGADPLIKLNGRDANVESVHGFHIGLVAPGSIGPFRYAFGASLVMPDQHLFGVRSVPFNQIRFIYYDNRMQRVFLAANIAVQIVPGLYVGGGIAFLSRTQGNVDLKGNIAYPDADESQLVSKIDVGLLAARYPQFGLLWEPTKWLSLGVSYRHSFILLQDQTFRIQGDIGNVGARPIVSNGYFQTETMVADLFQPWQLTVGGAVRFRHRILVSYDLTYARWSEFPSYLPVSISLDVGVLTSAVKLTPARTYPSPGFSDIVIPRIGVEWRAVDRERVALDLRGGYAYEPTPVPEQRNETNLADNDKHTFSVGAGLTLNRLGDVLLGSLSIDVHFAATYLPERVNRKNDPLDATGDFESDGVVLQAGLTTRVRF